MILAFSHFLGFSSEDIKSLSSSGETLPEFCYETGIEFHLCTISECIDLLRLSVCKSELNCFLLTELCFVTKVAKSDLRFRQLIDDSCGKSLF